MPKQFTQFWSPEAQNYLILNGRQDLVDRGNAFAERVTALMVGAKNRVDDWLKDGDLYNNKGGTPLVGQMDSMEYFVNDRLSQEIQVLESFLQVFHELGNNKLS